MHRTIVCHCEDITLGELLEALEQGYREIESLKRYTGIATGPCQGKGCIVQTLRVLASARGRAAIERGLARGPGEPPRMPAPADLVRIPTMRPPVIALSIDAWAAAAADERPNGEGRSSAGAHAATRPEAGGAPRDSGEGEDAP